jgi:hypothetical protein
VDLRCVVSDMADFALWARMVVAAADGSRLTVPLTGEGPPDLAVVEALARFQLMAHRAGDRVWLEDVSTALGDLLDLAGLRRQMIRQAEGREQALGVEEEVQADDTVP